MLSWITFPASAWICSAVFRWVNDFAMIQQADILRVAQNDLGQELAARKDRHQTLDHARILYQCMQQRFIAAIEEPFQIYE